MDQENKDSVSQGIMWWATLVVAVLAVPAFGFIVASGVQVNGALQLVVFVLACWLCTYLGMKLMHAPGMSKKIIDRK
jgi:hypothetical protein